MRKTTIVRETTETAIDMSLTVDGRGEYDVDTGCGFLNHMLELFARHGRFDLEVKCLGDMHVDAHHTTEDIAISMGQAFRDALGDKKGITRYGDIILPMDEALIMAAADISGRGRFHCDFDIRARKVGDFDTELVVDFFEAFAVNAGITLHVRQIAGRNSHHIIEGAFKAVARALRKCVKIDEENKDVIPSTKGTL